MLKSVNALMQKASDEGSVNALMQKASDEVC